jgi:hypothetical protein
MHARTDGRTDGRTENIYSIFRDKLLLLGEHVLARFLIQDCKAVSLVQRGQPRAEAGKFC